MHRTGRREQGVDDYEIQVDITETCHPEVMGDRARVRLGLQGIITSVASANSKIVDDYDPAWIPGAHPSAFPHNKGGRPPKSRLSEASWAKCTLRRYPTSQFARSPGMIADMFNIIQRHNVNASASVQFRFKPSESEQVAKMSLEQVQSVLDIMTDRKLYGTNLTNRLAATGMHYCNNE